MQFAHTYGSPMYSPSLSREPDALLGTVENVVDRRLYCFGYGRKKKLIIRGIGPSLAGQAFQVHSPTRFWNCTHITATLI